MEYKLKDLLQDKGYIRGPFGSALKRAELKTNGIPVYEQQHAIYANRDFRYYIDDEKYNELKRFTVKTNDLIISCSGTIGKVDFIKENDKKGIISQALLILRPNTEIVNPKYLYYFFKSNYGYNCIVSRSMGSVQVNIAKREFIENIKINLPSKDNQNKIIKILENIDKKIDLNNKINDNLHKVAKGVFNRWFIDFNYPNANGKMKESTLGLIPEEWRISKLFEIADCQNGYAFYKDGYDEEGTMVIDLGNVNLNSTFVYTNADKYVLEDRLKTEKFNKYKVKKNDLIMVMTDRKATMELLGKTGKIYEDKEFLLNQRMYRIRSKVNTNYLYTALNSNVILNKLKGKALGSVQKYINTGHINELELVIGTDEIMEKFSNVVDPIYSEIENRTVENTKLERIRNILLPKLMNGEINLDKLDI